jgi:hypothetical protein
MIDKQKALTEIRRFITDDLVGKNLIISFFQKKFERLSYLSSQDPYSVINDNFVENRGSEPF